MDFVASIISIATDANRIDKQFRNLMVQLNYVLEKTKKIHSKADQQSHVYIFLSDLIIRAEQMQNTLSQLLSQKNLSIKQKIRLSLPIDKTKDQIKQLIQLLQKGYGDLKEHLEQQQLDKRQQNQNADKCIKRKLKSRTLWESSFNSVPIREIQSEQPYDLNQDMMGPTIKQDQADNVQKIIELVVQLNGEEKILQTIKKISPDLLRIHKKVSIEDHHQILLYTLARKNFAKVYGPLKQVMPDIDRISKQNHFQIVWRRKITNQQAEKQSLKVNKPDKVSDKSSKKHSAKKCETEDQFFSFPTEKISKSIEKGQIVLYKIDESKTAYKQKQGQWVKIDHGCSLNNGDKIAGFIKTNQINDKNCKPSLYFELRFSLPE